MLDLTPQTPPMPVPSRFVREETIAEGDVVSVSHARDLLAGRAVTLVQVRPERAADTFLRARFAREARLLEAIDHSNVARVIASGIEYGLPFIATEAVAGRTLAEIVRAREPFPSGEAIGLARQMLAGLGAIHAAGLLHLKLTPRTILVGDDGILRITDVGIASLEGADDGAAYGTAIGIARYLAPELIEGGDVCEATDLYAVGAILFEVLTGRPPFPGENPVLVRFAHVQAPPPVPSQVVTSDIPPELDAVVLRALAKDPTRRYADARAMASALPTESTTTGVDRVISESATVGNVAPVRTIADRTVAASPIEAPGVGRIERRGRRRQAAGGWAWPIAIACGAIVFLVWALAVTLSGNVRIDDAGIAVDARESSQPVEMTSGRVAPSPTARLVHTLDEDAVTVSTANAYRVPAGSATRTPKAAQ